MPVISYGTPNHDALLVKILECFHASDRAMSELRPGWNKADKLYRTFVKETSADAKRRTSRDAGDPQYTTIVLPLSYATLLTAHTFWASVFLSRNPVFQYAARHGEGQDKVQAVEALIDYQVRQANMLPVLFNWLLDAGKYGLGVVSNFWTEEVHRTEVEVPQDTALSDIANPDELGPKKEVREIPGYRGNELFSIRPHDFFPDPNVSVTQFQKGEYYGRLFSIGWNTIARKKHDGSYFNIKQLKERGGGKLPRESSSTLNLPQDGESYNRLRSTSKGVVQGLEMTVELIPSDWELGSSTFPEKWMFTIGNGNVIIQAAPLGKANNKFPVFVNTYEIDPYSFASRGMLEILEPLNNAGSWLVNSHFFNVRKALNDKMLVDPSKVWMKDLEDGGPGGAVRLRPSAYGTDVRTVLTQFPIIDITRSHINDTEFFAELIKMVSGVNSNMLGNVNPGGRKTATEIRTSSTLGVNRMKTFAEYNSALGWAPLGQDLLQNSQQHYTDTEKFRIVGDQLDPGEQLFTDVSPEAIAGFYDYVPVDGTFPIDRFAQAELFQGLVASMAQVPEVLQQFDISKMINFVARLMGIKNMQSFRLQVAPDNVVAQEAQAGNVIPAESIPGGVNGSVA